MNKPIHSLSPLPRSAQVIGWAIPFVAVALACFYRFYEGYWN